MARGRIKCGKQFIFGDYFGFGQGIEHGGFAGIGIADDGYNGNGLGCPLLAMDFTLSSYRFNFFAQFRDTAANAAAVYFEFCFTRPAHANGAACTTRATGSSGSRAA